MYILKKVDRKLSEKYLKEYTLSILYSESELQSNFPFFISIPVRPYLFM